jgi:hypothetical protein
MHTGSVARAFDLHAQAWQRQGPHRDAHPGRRHRPRSHRQRRADRRCVGSADRVGAVRFWGGGAEGFVRRARAAYTLAACRLSAACALSTLFLPSPVYMWPLSLHGTTNSKHTTQRKHMHITRHTQQL